MGVKPTLALDVYGTLFNPQSIELAVAQYAGNQAAEVVRVWQEKQREYACLRGLTRRFRDFSVCTQDALHYCIAAFKLQLTAADESYLMEMHQQLPLYTDVEAALSALSQQWRLFAFTNANRQAVNALLERARVKALFDGVISVEDIKTYKPDPAAYTHFLQVTDSDPESTWLVSACSSDVIGAGYVGMRTIWVQRDSNVVFPPWGEPPEFTVSALTNIAERINIKDSAQRSVS